MKLFRWVALKPQAAWIQSCRGGKVPVAGLGVVMENYVNLSEVVGWDQPWARERPES